jgi:hypothetical protein
MDELSTADQAFLHRDPAPGAQAIGNVCQRGIQWHGHGRHCLRGPQILSTERATTLPVKLFVPPGARLSKFVI